MQNGQMGHWVEQAQDAVQEKGLVNASDRELQAALIGWQTQAIAKAFQDTVGIAKREVLQAIHTFAPDPPAPRPRRSRRDIIVHIGLPAVGGGAIFVGIIAGIIELIRRLTG